MKSATTSKVGTGTHKPLVTSSNLVAATNSSLVIASAPKNVIASEAKQSNDPEQGTAQNQQAYLSTSSGQGISITVDTLRIKSDRG